MPFGFSRIFSASRAPIRALGLNFTLFLLVVTSSMVWPEGFRWYFAQSMTSRSIMGLLKNMQKQSRLQLLSIILLTSHFVFNRRHKIGLEWYEVEHMGTKMQFFGWTFPLGHKHLCFTISKSYERYFFPLYFVVEWKPKPQETCDSDRRFVICEVSRICINAVLLQGSLTWQPISRKLNWLFFKCSWQ